VTSFEADVETLEFPTAAVIAVRDGEKGLLYAGHLQEATDLASFLLGQEVDPHIFYPLYCLLHSLRLPNSMNT
jgi:hypothetical protein